MRQRKKKPLKQGMVYCKKCKGNGLVKPYRKTKFHKVTNKCRYCKGIGQIDWIDNITGKVHDDSYYNVAELDFKKMRYKPIVTATQLPKKYTGPTAPYPYQTGMIFFDYISTI